MVNSLFSHIYIERRAMDYPDSQHLLKKYPDALRVYVDDYKDVFNRLHQKFQVQKRSMKLILAVKKDHFLYQGSEQAPAFGHHHFYYNSLILNCIYNCDYCYLQGMYPSANIVVFVNSGDFFAETQKRLEEHPIYLCISYDTDLLAFENVISHCARWIEFAARQNGLVIEIRTKSSNYKAISHLRPNANVILAWTLSPQEIIDRYEKGTPSLKSRLNAARSAIRDGWKVRLCFDPVIQVERWREKYMACVDEVSGLLPAEMIHDVSIGVFRMNSGYLSRIKKQRVDSDLLYYPFEKQNGTISYPKHERDLMIQAIADHLLKYYPKEKIFA